MQLLIFFSILLLVIPRKATGLFEEDIVLLREQEESIELNAQNNPNDENAPESLVVRNPRSLWPNGVVVYRLDPSLNSQARSAIQDAMNAYVTQTCIRFTERTSEADYVNFFPGGGCSSYIGRVGGRQDISIGRGCETIGVVIHEIFHALGRWHEQSRPDRNMFVRIIEGNIVNGRQSQFQITDLSRATYQGIPYDIGSVMHYSARAFSRNGQPTILPVDTSFPLNRIGQRDGLSASDIQHVRTLYCSGTPTNTASWSSWSSWSRCSRTCNGGSRTRTRTCVGGTSCAGTNIQTQQCNTNSCPVVATWSTWSDWSSCSRTCGGGRQTRIRSCVNGNTCVGTRAQFRDCSTQSCPQPAAWASWSSWSACTSTCQGGRRQRTRRCENGNTCAGSSINTEACNTNVLCVTQPSPNTGEWSSWSRCSAMCGGGRRYRVQICRSGSNLSGCTTQSEVCNSQECRPEPELKGIKHRGCWYLNNRQRNIGSFERRTPELSDNAFTRTNPVSKCGTAAERAGYVFFGVTLGYCVSGSNNAMDYEFVNSTLCEDGKGSYSRGWYIMDVYQINNTVSFSDSVAQMNIATAPTTMNTTTASGYKLTHDLLLIVSTVVIVILAITV